MIKMALLSCIIKPKCSWDKRLSAPLSIALYYYNYTCLLHSMLICPPAMIAQ